MTSREPNPENLPPKELDKFIEGVLAESSEEAKADQIEREMNAPMSWSERRQH